MYGRSFFCRLFSHTLLLFTKQCGVVDFPSGFSLSAGRAVSLLGVNACGVSPVPLLLQESRAFAPINLKEFRFKTTIFMKRAFLKNSYRNLVSYILQVILLFKNFRSKTFTYPLTVRSYKSNLNAIDDFRALQHNMLNQAKMLVPVFLP